MKFLTIIFLFLLTLNISYADTMSVQDAHAVKNEFSQLPNTDLNFTEKAEINEAKQVLQHLKRNNKSQSYCCRTKRVAGIAKSKCITTATNKECGAYSKYRCTAWSDDCW